MIFKKKKLCNKSRKERKAEEEFGERGLSLKDARGIERQRFVGREENR